MATHEPLTLNFMNCEKALCITIQTRSLSRAVSGPPNKSCNEIVHYRKIYLIQTCNFLDLEYKFKCFFINQF